MEWWQTGTSMQWWQIVLIILASIAAGVMVATFIIYLISQFVSHREVSPLPNIVFRSEGKRKTATTAEEQLESFRPGLLVEIKNNRRIAADPWTGKLLPFEHQIWDAIEDEVHRLPANLREVLTQAYADMRLANSIVKLSTEVGHRSQALYESYMKMCTAIAARLNRIMPLPE